MRYWILVALLNGLFILPNLAVLSGALILVSGWVFWRRR